MRNNSRASVYVVVGLCAVVLLVSQLVSDASAVSTKKKVNNNKGQHAIKNKIVVTDTITTTINSVIPSYVVGTNPTNITVNFYGTYVYNCVHCVFNVSSTQNVTTATYSYNNYYSTLTCPFPSSYISRNGVVAVWLEECTTSIPQVYTNRYPVYAFPIPPTIQSISPSTIYATGGVNVTVTIRSPFNYNPFNQQLYPFCIFSDLTSPVPAYSTNDPTKVLCPVPVIPIGPGNLTIAWSTSSYYYYNTGLATNTYEFEVRGNRILSASPNTGCVLGGGNVTVNLEYPSASTVGITCLFSVINDAGEVEEVDSSEAVLVGQGSYLCQTVPWSLSNGLKAILSLVAAYTNAPLTNPVEFTFYSNCIHSASPTTVCSLGSSPVTLLGHGLPALNSYYTTYLRATFYSGPLGSKNSYAVGYSYASAINDSALLITTSTATYNFDQYWVQISSAYSFNASSYPLIELKNTNSCLSSVNPSVYNENGGDKIVINSNMPAFSLSTCYPNPSCYYCTFQDAAGIKYYQTATYVSPTELTCISPPVSTAGVGTLAIQSYPTTSGVLTTPWTVKWLAH